MENIEIASNREIYDATIEAIISWNRSEHFYHRYFSKLDKIYRDKVLLAFFARTVFDVFLKEYSIRRNLTKGYKSVDAMIDELIQGEFFSDVQKGHKEVIDSTSNRLKYLARKATKSLLSKVAFLINPMAYSLYDTLTKQTLWKIMKPQGQVKRSELESYMGFKKRVNDLHNQFSHRKLFDSSDATLEQFRDTEAYLFFSKNRTTGDQHLAYRRSPRPFPFLKVKKSTKPCP